MHIGKLCKKASGQQVSDTGSFGCNMTDSEYHINKTQLTCKIRNYTFNGHLQWALSMGTFNGDLLWALSMSTFNEHL